MNTNEIPIRKDSCIHNIVRSKRLIPEKHIVEYCVDCGAKLLIRSFDKVTCTYSVEYYDEVHRLLQTSTGRCQLLKHFLEKEGLPVPAFWEDISFWEK